MSQERIIHSELLERLEVGQDVSISWNAGNQMLQAEIDYRKDRKPRGYYLVLSTFLHGDNGFKRSVISFGGEGDLYQKILLQETKAFSQKTFDAITISQEMLAPYLEAARVRYRQQRARQLTKQERDRERMAQAV